MFQGEGTASAEVWRREVHGAHGHLLDVHVEVSVSGSECEQG